jgi:hypothetical protein
LKMSAVSEDDWIALDVSWEECVAFMNRILVRG